ncbi:MAG: response regulator [Nitrospirae bacterium]|nr:response regulator [Nitrospirota bacterium]
MAGKILVVDDEPLILTAVERALSKVGHGITKAQNMKELDEALRLAPFDLLITDVYMEDETSDTIIEKVRQTSPGIRVLRMSGSLGRDHYENFIEKPFSIETLRRRVNDILNEPS